MSDPFDAIERLIAHDPGGRGIGALVRPGHLQAAARSLAGAGRVLIATGFFVAEAGAGETDGPPGAKALGDALARLAIPAGYVTDEWNRPYLEAVGAAPLHQYAPELGEREAPTHLVAIERLGRAADGRYYTMRAEDVTAFVAPLDDLFLAARGQGRTTIGIGDGGNEIGMGAVAEQVRAHVAHGERIASTVATDFLIAAGVSNWGAYGLVAALSVVTGRDLLPSGEAAEAAVHAMVAAGAVDGVTRRAEPTVDGRPLAETLALLAELRALAAQP